MTTPEQAYESLKRQWIDQFVEVRPDRPELQRFQGLVGRVVTVNYNGKAIIDFQDGAWYDISASDEVLNRLDPAAAAPKYNPKANSNQPFPEKQG